MSKERKANLFRRIGDDMEDVARKIREYTHYLEELKDMGYEGTNAYMMTNEAIDDMLSLYKGRLWRDGKATEPLDRQGFNYSVDVHNGRIEGVYLR